MTVQKQSTTNLPSVLGHVPSIVLLKFEILQSINLPPVEVFQILLLFRAYSVDPDQRTHFAASDLGLHCLQKLICPNT